MPISAMRSWFGRPERLPVRKPEIPAPAVLTAGAPPVEELPVWTPVRLGATDTLWGEGFQFPGGEIELMRLAKPLGLSGASSVLLLGAGGGGPACALTMKLGTKVSGFEADPALAAAAIEMAVRQNLDRRVQIVDWNPLDPVFPKHAFHHCMALEPLNGARPEPVLAALGASLRTGAQLVVTETVADVPLDRTDAAVVEWAALERRDVEAVPSEVAITRILGRLGFDVRAAEDISQRHIHQAMTGWRVAVRFLGQAAVTRAGMEAFEREAALWTARLRLFQLGRLRMIRWHAVGGG